MHLCMEAKQHMDSVRSAFLCLSPYVFMLRQCLKLNLANKVYLNLNLKERLTDRGEMFRCFPSRLFLRLTVFNPQQSHDINYSFLPQVCMCARTCVCVFVRKHPPLVWIHFLTDGSFVSLDVSTVFTFLQPIILLCSVLKNSIES